MDVSAYAPALDALLAHLEFENARILDVACGPGNVAHYLSVRKPGLMITGVDAAEQMVLLARQQVPSGNFFMRDARNLHPADGPFEAIVCSFCLPYLNPEETNAFFRTASQLLAPGGLFYISTMEAPADASGVRTNSTGDQLMIYYYEHHDLERWLSGLGFTVVFLHRVQYPDRPFPDHTDLFLIARLGIPTTLPG